MYETKEKTDRVYGAGSRLLETRDATFSYDEEGNLVQKVEKNGDTWKYEYNGNGMMSKVIKPDNTEVTFKYDSLGRRIEKCSDEKTMKFIWDGNTILHEYFLRNNSDEFEDLEEYSSQNKSEIPDNLVTWVFNDGFVPSAKITNEGNYSIISDYLGSPVEAFDDEGKKVWSAELDIYGRVVEFTGKQDFIPFRYQGQYEDIEIGLYYNRFRYYDPEQGSYTQIDPIGLAGGNPTLYGYVGNPNISIDPLGLRKSSYGASKKGYSTKDEAALAVLEYINPRSIKQNTEYGGFVYQKDGQFYTTKPKKGTTAGFKPITALSRVPEGATVVGNYHTHGAEDARFKSNEFSQSDFRVHDSSVGRFGSGQTSYLGTPSEGFKKYDHENGVQSLKCR
ncbi:DUF4329 domain-containing protein [Lysinibacillus xylanilyticus]|uniref:DUF4329 domain-containing protein n=1 Tax=Lysinibacillus xylanilyticus TaxID=582475 RepID=UPI003D07A8D2